MSIKTSVHAYNKLLQLYPEVASTFDELTNTGEEIMDHQFMDAMDKIEDVQKQIKKVDISDIEDYLEDEGNLDALDNVKKNLRQIGEDIYYMGKKLLGDSYYKDLLKAVPRFITAVKKKYPLKYSGDANELATDFVSLITHPDRVERYKSNIESILRGNMTLPYFSRILDALLSAKKSGASKKEEEQGWPGEELYYASQKEIGKREKDAEEVKDYNEKERWKLKDNEDQEDILDGLTTIPPREFTKKLKTTTKFFIETPDGKVKEFFSEDSFPVGSKKIISYVNKKGESVYSYIAESFISLRRYKKANGIS